MFYKEFTTKKEGLITVSDGILRMREIWLADESSDSPLSQRRQASIWIGLDEHRAQNMVTNRAHVCLFRSEFLGSRIRRALGQQPIRHIMLGSFRAF